MTDTAELERLAPPATSAVKRVRRVLAGNRTLKSAYYLVLTAGKLVHWSNERTLARWLDSQFGTPDPWQYRSCAEEQARFASALRMLDEVRAGRSIGRCFEIGCAEGVFTSMLAPRCEELTAVDISQVALSRAKATVPQARFATWNLRHDDFPTGVNLIVLMDVLEMFPPREIASAREKVVSALKDGGLLLIGNSRQDPIFETAWWSKWLICGGKRIAEYFAQDRRLQLLSLETQDLCVNALFRRTDAP